jgi:hydrogenase expression/formation protein HypC
MLVATTTLAAEGVAMCLAIPGMILERFQDQDLPMGLLDVSGARVRTCLALTPEAGVGDWVIVHAGFALQVLDETEAQATLDEIARLAAVPDPDTEPPP